MVDNGCSRCQATVARAASNKEGFEDDGSIRRYFSPLFGILEFIMVFIFLYNAMNGPFVGLVTLGGV